MELSTRISLLHALRKSPENNDLWRRFDAQYREAIEAWAMRQGLERTDAADVAQEVMIKLFRALPRHVHDASRSFRSWLKSVVNNAARDLHRKKSRRKDRAGMAESQFEALAARLAENASLDALTHSLNQLRDPRLKQAQDRVQGQVDERTWRAFALATVDEWSTADIAAELKMTPGSVYKAKYRVGAMLQKAYEASVAG